MLYGLLALQQVAAVRHAQVDAARGTARAGVARADVKLLQDRVDKLTLVCMAMWELLRDKAQLSEAELMEKVKEIDLRDGVPDGKVTKTVAQCPKCNRVMSPRHKRCMYCGAARLNVTAFDSAL